MDGEACEDEAGLRQARLGPHRRAFGDPAARIVRLISVGQVDDFLAVMQLLGFGYQDAIGNDVIHERRTRGAGRAKIIHLQRAWPQRENVDAFAAGIAVEIDQDVDFAFADGFCRGRIGLPRYIREGIESGDESLPNGAAVVDAVIEAVNLETAFVVRLEETRAR